MWALKFLLYLALAYALVAALIYITQSALLFPTRMVGASPPLPPRAERLLVHLSDGKELHGIHIPSDRPAASDRLVILGFGGNAWNADAVASFLHELYPDADVVAFHYRGYRPSTGAPTAAALLADAPLLHDHVAERLGRWRIVAVGFSVGSGVAARLARERSLAGLILVTPFDSLAAVAAQHYRWLPVRLLFRHEMPAARDLRSTRLPVAVLAAEHDTLIPPARTEALRRQLPNLVFDRTIAGAGHNDIYQDPSFAEAMGEALAKIAG